MCPHRYYTLMRESKDPRHLRLRMVQETKRVGVKPTARLYGMSPNTVRKWVRRFDGTLESLAERSRAPHHTPRKLPPQAEAAIVRAKRKLPTWGARRLKRDMNLPYSVKAIQRVLKQRGLTRRWRRKKTEVKRSLRAIKRQWPLWRQISMDTKHLYDLPEYVAQARLKDLPLYQYTAREVSTGALFLAYAGELSLTYAELFAQRLVEHLQRHNVDLTQVTWQTDNGSEFIGSWQAVADSAFTRTVQAAGSSHRTIPPGQYRYQADVETVHSLMEVEFFLEPFEDRRDFIEKADTYQNFFNYVRPNSAKEEKSPWQLIQEKKTDAKPSLLYLPPVLLEHLLDERLITLSGVHHVRDHP